MADDPLGYSVGVNPPPNAVDPGMWARLMGYAGGFNPIASAHAGGAPAPDSPAARQAAIAAAAAQMNNGGPGASQGPQGPPVPPGVVPPVVAAPPTPETLQRIQETINGGGAPVGGGGSSGGGGASAAYRPSEFEPAGRHMPAPQDLGPAGSHMPFPGQLDPRGYFAPPQAQQQQASPLASAPLPPVRPAATIDPRMRGEVPPVVQPGWGTISRPNQNPGTGGGMLGGALASPRGSGGPDKMGVFNFGSLFGGGQPAAAAAPSKQKIDVGKIPANARAEVPPDASSKAPSDYGPLQKGRNWKLKSNNPDLYR